MTDETIERTERRRNLILTIMRAKFEDNVYEYLEEGAYSTVEELDSHIDAMLRHYETEVEALRSYYRALTES